MINRPKKKVVAIDLFFLQYNIRSYPSTVFYNNTMPHSFRGRHSADTLIEFIEVGETSVRLLLSSLVFKGDELVFSGHTSSDIPYLDS